MQNQYSGTNQGYTRREFIKSAANATPAVMLAGGLASLVSSCATQILKQEKLFDDVINGQRVTYTRFKTSDGMITDDIGELVVSDLDGKKLKEFRIGKFKSEAVVYESEGKKLFSYNPRNVGGFHFTDADKVKYDPLDNSNPIKRFRYESAFEEFKALDREHVVLQNEIIERIKAKGAPK